MTPTFFDQYTQSSKKVLFLYNMRTGGFDYLSRTVEDLWETNYDKVLQDPKRLLDPVEENDREAAALRLGQAGRGLAAGMELGLRFDSDRTKRVRVEAHPIRDEDGALTHVMGEAEDVTGQARYREYLLEFARKKDNVLQIVAHDLQAPLSHVKSVAALLEADHAERNYGDIATYTRIMHRAYEDCTKLIKEVLRDEHTKSLTTPLNRERFDVVAKARQTAETFVRSEAVRVPIRVLSPQETITAELDEMKFTQVLNNLITNSVKFTPPEGEITITLEQRDGTLLLTHADTGIGIPLELQPHLFQRHDGRAARRGLNGEESNGIGLSIVKDLVELQGGSIRLESGEGEGTTFHLAFPLL